MDIRTGQLLGIFTEPYINNLIIAMKEILIAMHGLDTQGAQVNVIK